MTNIKHRLTPHPVKIRAGKDQFYLALRPLTLMIPGSAFLWMRLCSVTLKSSETLIHTCTWTINQTSLTII